MPFLICGLPLALFAPLFSLSDRELAARNIMHRAVDRTPGFPCRVSLRDAEPGETVLLLNYEHHPANSPYRSSHAIYVREHARQAEPAVCEIPPFLHERLLSVRAFDTEGCMVDADIAAGTALAPMIEHMFTDARAAYLHIHNARPGCYVARVERA